MAKTISRALAIALLALCACAGTAETRTRTALEVIGQAGEGAYALAQAQCQREQSSYASAGAQAALEASITRCDDVYGVFEQIAALHGATAAALERGDLEEAQVMLAQVSRMWAELRGAP